MGASASLRAFFTGSSGPTRVSSAHGGSRPTASGTRPTAPLDQHFIDETTQRLVVYLGPIAKIVARKAAQQAQTQEEFVHIVASHIGTQDRLMFLREVGMAG